MELEGWRERRCLSGVGARCAVLLPSRAPYDDRVNAKVKAMLQSGEVVEVDPDSRLASLRLWARSVEPRTLRSHSRHTAM